MISISKNKSMILKKVLSPFIIMLIFLFAVFIVTGLAAEKAIIVSGVGSGELLLNLTIQDIISNLSNRYSYDIEGIHIPPISSNFNISFPEKVIKNAEGRLISGYAYEDEGIYMPASPNNFTVSARNVENLNLGLRKIQGSYENSSMIWKAKYTRVWVTTQILADKNGVATTTSDLISPGSYDVKIFGDAAENVSHVNLTMTLIKKVIVNDRFNLSINTTGFPSGKYSITAKALNGSFRLDEIKLAGLSTLG